MATKEHESILDILIGIFLGGSERKKLRNISKRLANRGYRYIKRDHIQPEFASLAYSFYKETELSRKILNKFLSQETFTYSIMLSAVPDHIRSLFFLVDANEIRMRAKSLDWEELQKETNSALLSIREYFSEKSLIRVNNAFRTIYAYRAFCMFDFFMLLRRFNSGLKEKDFSGTPHFKQANGLSTIDFVADFESALQYFLMAEDWNVIHAFFTYVNNGNDAISMDDHGVLYQKATHLNNDNVLVNMCKLVHHNPDYTINPPTVPNGKIEELLRKIFREADETLKEIYQTQRKEKIDALVSSIFTSESNFALEYYSTKINKSLIARKIQYFTYAVPIGYLKAFFNENIKSKLKIFTDAITIKGRSPSPNIIKEFFQISEELFVISDSIRLLDEKASPSSDIGGRIHAARTSENGYSDLANVVRDVEMLNTEASTIIRRAQSSLTLFKGMVSKFAMDSKKPQGEIIENWKEINSMANSSAHEYFIPLVDKIQNMQALLSLFIT